MPDPTQHHGRASRPPPPPHVLTTPQPEGRNKRTLARPRSKTLGNESRPGMREGVDADSATTSPRRRKRGPHSKSSSAKARNRSNTESSFFPKLARILESGDSSFTRRTEGRSDLSSQHRRQRAHSPARARRSRQDHSSVGSHKRSPAKQHRVGSLHRRSEPFPRLNPSLLSVLSSLTRASEQSSGSGTTVTQKSYDRSVRNSGSARSSQVSVSEANTRTVAEPNVFDYLDATMDDDGDDRSICSSSSSSHYRRSDAGSSEQPDTPSSHSSYPSPTMTRHGSIGGSVAELRRKYDVQYAASIDSRRSSSRSPEASRSPPRIGKKLPQLRDVAEDDEQDSDAQSQSDGGSREGRQTVPFPPTEYPVAQPQDERLQAQQEALKHHVAQDQQHHAHRRVDSAFGQHRSHSSSSNRSGDSQRAWAQYMHDMQMQQYQYASPAVPVACPVPQHLAPGYGPHVAPPVAPDAPDHTQQTILGYELVARELANAESVVKPVYRRFEYLNHRILLHMQDELQEMEEQLRRVDEIIATLEPPLSAMPMADGSQPQTPSPSSRRQDKSYGTHWHHQRTELLGRIFLKTKDYNAAVASFAKLTKDSAAAEKSEITSYREWLAEKSPIHEVETRFLSDEYENDLIKPGIPPLATLRMRRRVSSSAASFATDHGSAADTSDRSGLLALGFLPMLPLLLYTVIPTLAGRLIATIFITMGAVLVAATTQIGGLMSVREWGVCASAYVLVSVGIAACVPLHSG